MDRGAFAQVRRQEPALLTALLTLVGGFVAQIGPGHIASLRALGTSVGVSGLQGILTRERVYSPASLLGRGSDPLIDVRSATPWLAQGAEPALAMALVGSVVGFLVQLVGGNADLLSALGISAGLAGTQGVLTRQQVHSPRSVAIEELAMGAGLQPGTPSGELGSGQSGLAEPARPAAAGSATAAGAIAITPGATHPDPALEPGRHEPLAPLTDSPRPVAFPPQFHRRFPFPRVLRIQFAAIRSADFSTSSARKAISPKLPIGVATT